MEWEGSHTSRLLSEEGISLSLLVQDLGETKSFTVFKVLVQYVMSFTMFIEQF